MGFHIVCQSTLRQAAETVIILSDQSIALLGQRKGTVAQYRPEMIDNDMLFQRTGNAIIISMAKIIGLDTFRQRIAVNARSCKQDFAPEQFKTVVGQLVGIITQRNHRPFGASFAYPQKSSSDHVSSA